LQELWQPETIDRLTATLQVDFPYSHYSVQATGGGSLGAPGCTENEATLLTTCLSDNCAGVEGNGLVLCAVDRCAPAFAEVSMGCQQCIAANQAATDVGNLTNLCSAGDGAAAVYTDQTGLLLLSRHPLTELDYLAFESSLGDRGVLSARIQTAFAGPVDVFCTHLAASLGDVPYDGAYGSFEGERLVQIEQLLEQVTSKRSPDGGVALLGDMNCGPETAQASAASPDAFERFAAAGFESPYTGADGRCTFCSNNPLNGFAEDEDEGVLIDHVLLSGFSEAAPSVVARVFDAGITITAEGAPVETAHSDHYGVRVDVSGAEAAAQ
jgi:endonuclease/exonuclease/phosphatase family metal-dependent hydrolase